MRGRRDLKKKPLEEKSEFYSAAFFEIVITTQRLKKTSVPNSVTF